MSKIYLHFKQVFKVLEKIGLEFERDVEFEGEEAVIYQTENRKIFT